LQEALRSTIYCVELETGKAIPLTHVFQQKIGRLIFGPDDKLYVRNDEFVGRGWRQPDGSFKLNKVETLIPATKVFHFYRIPVR
jgi:hypothetical protein